MKKLIAILLIATLCFTSVAYADEVSIPSPPMTGGRSFSQKHIHEPGPVVITDALEILMFIAGLPSVHDTWTGNWAPPTINDAIVILAYLAGIR
jgi:hypothetical protein